MRNLKDVSIKKTQMACKTSSDIGVRPPTGRSKCQDRRLFHPRCKLKRRRGCFHCRPSAAYFARQKATPRSLQS